MSLSACIVSFLWFTSHFQISYFYNAFHCPRVSHSSLADEEDHVGKEEPADGKRNAKSLVKEAKSYASFRSSTHTEKKAQQMLAELHRLKTQMSEFHQSVQRPPV